MVLMAIPFAAIDPLAVVLIAAGVVLAFPGEVTGLIAATMVVVVVVEIDVPLVVFGYRGPHSRAGLRGGGLGSRRGAARRGLGTQGGNGKTQSHDGQE